MTKTAQGLKETQGSFFSRPGDEKIEITTNYFR
jgi:hypothetical protein